MKTLKDNSNKQVGRYKKIRQQKLTGSDLRELMGMNRDTYRRHKGAIRRK